MYRPSQGHGQQSQSHQTAGTSRIRRSEDPLAELARLIGQDDPFKEFDSVRPRRAAPNGNGSAAAPVVAPERRPERQTNGAVYGNAPRAMPQPRPNGFEAPRPSARTSQQAAPVARTDERYPAPRPAPAAAPQRSNGAVHRSYEERPAPAPRTNGYAPDRAPRARDPYAETQTRAATPAGTEALARRPEPQPASRYVPEEAPRHARSRPQQAPYQEPYQRGYENDYDPEYDDDAYLPEHADDIYDDVPRAGRSLGFWLVSGILVASAIAVAFLGYFAYRTIFNAQPRAAIVTKSNTPVKVEPQNAPQTTTPPSNKPIQDRLGAAPNQTELLQREENPVDLTRQPPAQQQQQTPQPVMQQPTKQQVAPPAQQQKSQTPPNGEVPKRVKSVPLRSDGPVQQPAGPQSRNDGPIQLSPNAQVQEQETETQAIPVAAPTRPAPNRNVASLGPTPAPQTSGNYVVQVASHKTPEEAQTAWSALRQQYAEIFGSRNADIRKVDLGDRGTFYRAMVGPMNRDQANALCQNLKTQGAGCIVQTR